jgi:hypothetical protein
MDLATCTSSFDIEKVLNVLREIIFIFQIACKRIDIQQRVKLLLFLILVVKLILT